MRVRTFSLLAAIVSLAASPALAAEAPAKAAAAPKAKAAGAQLCNGTFSNGVSVNVKAAVYMPDAGYITGSTLAINGGQHMA